MSRTTTALFANTTRCVAARRWRSDIGPTAANFPTTVVGSSKLPASECPFSGPPPPSADNSATPLPYSSIPTPKGLPLVGTLFEMLRQGGTANLHLYCNNRHRQLGDLYREKLGVVDSVFVSDVGLVQQVYRQEGKYPEHMVPEPWIIHNQKTNNPRGLFFMDGPLWLQRRRSMNRVFFTTFLNSAEQADSFNAVVSDVLERWENDLNADGELVGLENTIYRWSIESLGALIFQRRMGCLGTEGLKDINVFVHSVQQIFTESAKMTVIPPRLASSLRLPVWNRFVKAVSSSLALAKGYVEDTVREIAAKAEAGQQPDGFLAQMLLRDRIPIDEIVRIVTDLFIAAADTTSHSTQWSLYLLAKNQDWQEAIYNEIKNIAPPDTLLTNDHINQLPIIKAVVKESLRMYPVAPFLTRILTEDVVLNSYHIPAGKLVLMSLYTIGRDPKYFVDPDVFNPARWLKKESSNEKIVTHASLPFGLGSRACIGQRVAQVQMHLLLARTLQKFHLELTNKNDVEIKLRLITTPSENICLKLTKRINV